ncbi:hypothetical protein GVAV_001207 [Gurleya vavrai]
MKELDISIISKKFKRLNFIFSFFDSFDDIFIRSENVILKFSSNPSIVQFGFSKIYNDIKWDNFYQNLLYKQCLKNEVDVFFQYDLKNYYKIETILKYLFYTFYPVFFRSVDEFEKYIDELGPEKLNFYNILISIFNMNLKISVKNEFNLYDNILRETGQELEKRLENISE